MRKMSVAITSNQQYMTGTLNTQRTIGKGTIIEYVVMNTLGNCRKARFNYDYDLHSQKYGSINVKSSSRHKPDVSSTWRFQKPPKSYIPDYYICVGLNDDFTKILHVWAIPGTAKIVRSHAIVITDSIKGLKRAEEYELDHVPYEKTFQTIDLTEFPEFSNMNVDNFEQYQLIADDVKHGYSPADIIDEHGLDCYKGYLNWVKGSEFKKCFNLYNGAIGVYSDDLFVNGKFPTECFAEISTSLYPIYDYTFKFTGYYYNGSILKPAVQPSEHKSKMKTIEGIIKLYTIKYGKISIEDLKRELQEKQIDVDNIEMVLRKFMMRGDLLRKSPTEYFAVL